MIEFESQVSARREFRWARAGDGRGRCCRGKDGDGRSCFYGEFNEPTFRILVGIHEWHIRRIGIVSETQSRLRVKVAVMRSWMACQFTGSFAIISIED